MNSPTGRHPPVPSVGRRRGRATQAGLERRGHIGGAEIVANEQQRRPAHLGQGVGERIAEVQHAAMAHSPAVLDARSQREPRLGRVSGGYPDPGLGKEMVQILGGPQPVRQPPSS